MTWHMQQEVRLKMMTGCSEMRRRIRVSADSATSMEREVEEGEAGGGDKSRWRRSSEHRRRPCIAGGQKITKI